MAKENSHEATKFTKSYLLPITCFVNFMPLWEKKIHPNKRCICINIFRDNYSTLTCFLIKAPSEACIKNLRSFTM